MNASDLKYLIGIFQGWVGATLKRPGEYFGAKKLLLVGMQFARKKCYDTEEEFCHKSIYKQLYWLQEQNVVWMADHFMDHSWGDKVVH